VQLLRDYLVGDARVAFLASLISRFGVTYSPRDRDTFTVTCESIGESFIVPVTQFYAAVALAHSM
jgi:hypothetical protein